MQRRCHNNMNLTSPTSYFLHTSRAKTPFSSCQDGPETLPNGPEMAPRQAKIAPKWSKIIQDMPKMTQDGNLKRRRHINIELTSSWARVLRMSLAKTPFWPPPRGPNINLSYHGNGKRALRLRISKHEAVSPRRPKVSQDVPKMGPRGLKMGRCD